MTEKAPDGSHPVILSRGLYDAAKKLGYDMRWYCVARPMAISKNFEIFRKAEQKPTIL
ncbi:hypothetical protein EVC20_077 [Rhizobium phage RHph_Y2_17_1]|nr:hypothetical protein EVC19_077 [Rhizobium phage RHph_Y2_11]QIG75816.1 hypothetical protein EVC20_077 [Rhizobium phage RHph_Y2_17_1]